MTSRWVFVNGVILYSPVSNAGPSSFSDQPEERKPLSRTDESVTINSCHGPMREAEVLRDYLLQLCRGPDPASARRGGHDARSGRIRPLRGRPSVEWRRACPSIFLIPSWIGSPDRKVKSSIASLICWSFSRASTTTGRFWFVDSSVFRLRFELDDEDMVCFRRWIRECHAHWGLDGDHRQNFGSTKTDEHTWRHALDRMALGLPEGERGASLGGCLTMTRSRRKCHPFCQALENRRFFALSGGPSEG